MERLNSIDVRWVEDLVNTLDGPWQLLAIHAPVVVLCLLVAFRARGQTGGMFIMVGVGLLLLRQLLLLFAYQYDAPIQLTHILPLFDTLVSFSALLIGYGFVGVGIMWQHQNVKYTHSRVSRWLNIALYVSVAIELCMLVDRLASTGANSLVDSLLGVLHVVSLLLLVSVVTVRHVLRAQMDRQAAATQRQLDAMLSMFSAVKHDLNNDMQVVVGNAELAQLLIDSGSDIRKPVNNITSAANIAIDRIQQLSVFSATGDASSSAIDLNSVLRETTTKLSTEIPNSVVLRLELEHLPIRVMADRYLLGLSITHLIQEVVKTIDRRGEIVIRTYARAHDQTKPVGPLVVAEISVYRESEGFVDTKKSANQRLGKDLSSALSTAKALIERSGATSIGQTNSANESLISMSFSTEIVAKPQVRAIAVGESFG